MKASRATAKARSEESGAVLVLFALFMAVAILFSSFAIDVGNWFEHQRHLQVQAEASALAAAAKLTLPCTTPVEQAVYQTAGQYGGAATVTTPAGGSEAAATPLYNEQVGGVQQSNIHELINHKHYYNQSAGDTTTIEKAPCEPEATMIDVKMTETHLPWIFKALDVPYINAHARVSIVKEKYASAVEPIIESEPQEARAFFINSTIGGVEGLKTKYTENELLATAPLTNIGSNEEKGTIKWTNASAPAAVKIVAHTGVRIALAGKKGALTGAGNETLSVCTHAYVECFDEDSGIVPPLLNISGYSKEGEGTAEKPYAPVAHKVTLSTPSPDTCTDAYFNNFPGSELKATCTITISAEIQYGKESAVSKGMTVTPEFVYTEGFGNKTEKKLQTPLTLVNGVWTGTGSLPSYFYGNFGSTEINLVVACKPETGSPCAKAAKTETLTLKDVQRAFSAGPDGSNRIVAAKVFEPGAASPVPGEKDADAFEICEKADAQSCTHKLAVTIELQGSLEDAKKYLNKEGQPIPPFHVNFGDNDQENEDQFVIACPPTTNSTKIAELYEEALAHGCSGKYTVNTHGGSCTVEKEAQEKIASEEKAQKEAGEKEAAAKTKRENEEKEAREKWAKEEKETKLTKAQREAKEKTQKEAAEKAPAKEKTEREQWLAEEKAKPPKLTKAEREAKEKAQKEAAEKAPAKEKAEREQWLAEEKELKLTKAQREAKEAEQKVARETAEKAEATAKAKREVEEQATKKAKETGAAAAHECIGLVEATGSSNFKAGKEEAELTAVFQNYLAKRMENPVNGFHYYCPNNWKNNNNGGVPVIPPNDSRLIQFFVVPFTVTDFERKNEVSPLAAIETFATFYVTGWDSGNIEAGQGHQAWNPKERRDGCSEKLFKKLSGGEQAELENEGTPLKQREQKEKEKGFDDDTEQPREVLGHLIKYVNVLGEVAGTEACKLEGLETCEAVLTE